MRGKKLNSLDAIKATLPVGMAEYLCDFRREPQFNRFSHTLESRLSYQFRCSSCSSLYWKDISNSKKMSKSICDSCRGLQFGAKTKTQDPLSLVPLPLRYHAIKVEFVKGHRWYFTFRCISCGALFRVRSDSLSSYLDMLCLGCIRRHRGFYSYEKFMSHSDETRVRKRFRSSSILAREYFKPMIGLACHHILPASWCFAHNSSLLISPHNSIFLLTSQHNALHFGVSDDFPDPELYSLLRECLKSPSVKLLDSLQSAIENFEKTYVFF